MKGEQKKSREQKKSGVNILVGVEPVAGLVEVGVAPGWG